MPRTPPFYSPSTLNSAPHHDINKQAMIRTARGLENRKTTCAHAPSPRNQPLRVAYLRANEFVGGRTTSCTRSAFSLRSLAALEQLKPRVHQSTNRAVHQKYRRLHDTYLLLERYESKLTELQYGRTGVDKTVDQAATDAIIALALKNLTNPRVKRNQHKVEQIQLHFTQIQAELEADLELAVSAVSVGSL